MNKFIVTLLVLLMFPLVSSAVTGTSFDIGGTTYYNFSDGTNGNSFDIGGTTYYNLSDPVFNKPYDLGKSNNVSENQYEAGERYSDISMLLIQRACEGVSKTLYPDYAKYGVELNTKCLTTVCPPNGCDMVQFHNGISKCSDEGPRKALQEILNICEKEKSKQHIKKVNAVIDFDIKKQDELCPQFSQLFLNTPGCAKDTEYGFPVNKKDCCVCNIEYKNYKRSCIPESEYNKKIKDDKKNKKAVVMATASPKQDLTKNNEKIIKEISASSSSAQIIQEKINQIDKQQVTETNLEKPSNSVKPSWFKRFINFIFGKK